MAQIRGTAGYHLGNQGGFGAPAGAPDTSDPSPLAAIREQTSKIEDMLDNLAEPVKPYVLLHSLTAMTRALDPATCAINTKMS